MTTLNLNQSQNLYFGSNQVQKLYFRNKLLYPKNVDPYASNVVLYLKGNGVNNSTDIIDSSSNPKTISIFGNAKISTASSKYGGSSLSFDGTGASYLTVAASNDFVFTGDFTVESWINWSGTYINTGVVVCGTGAVSEDQLGLFFVSGQHSFYGYGSNVITISNLANNWHHLAVSRNGSNLKTFLNGSLIDTVTNKTNTIGSLNTMYIGRRSDAHYFSNYIDSLRITKGVGRYTANFNPETDTYLS